MSPRLGEQEKELPPSARVFSSYPSCKQLGLLSREELVVRFLAYPWHTVNLDRTDPFPVVPS